MHPVTPWRSERPLRNASPGDLRPREGAPWPGQSHVEDGPEGAFAAFVTVVDGWSAYILWLREAFFIRKVTTPAAIARLLVTPPAGLSWEAYGAEIAARIEPGELKLNTWPSQIQLLQAIMRARVDVPIWDQRLFVPALYVADANWKLFAPAWKAAHDQVANPPAPAQAEAPAPVDA